MDEAERCEEIRQELRGDVAILHLPRRMDRHTDVDPLHDNVRRLVSEGVTKVVVDLSSLRMAGDVLLATLTACLTTARQADGDIVLTGFSKTASWPNAYANLGQVFRIYASIDDAVAGFSASDNGTEGPRPVANYQSLAPDPVPPEPVPVTGPGDVLGATLGKVRVGSSRTVSRLVAALNRICVWRRRDR